MRAKTRRNYDVKFLHRSAVYLHWARAELLGVPWAVDAEPLFEPIACALEEAFLGLYGEPIEYRDHPDNRQHEPEVRLHHALDFTEIAAVSLAGVSTRRREQLPLESLRALLWLLRDRQVSTLRQRMPA